jgi:hypothetical protein
MTSDEDALYGKPQSAYRVKFMDKGALQAAFPKMADRIQNCDSSGFMDHSGSQSVGSDVGVDLIPVIMAFHLPRVKPLAEDDESEEPATEEAVEEGATEDAEPEPEDSEAPERGGGRYVYIVGDRVLEDKPYTDMEFPAEPLFRMRPAVGLKGIGLPEELSPIQKDRNVVSQRIQRGIHLMGQPHWLVDRNSKINTNKIDNQNSSIIEYSGNKPEAVTPPAAAPEMYQREVFLGQQAFEVTGISPQLAQGMRPVGVNSGEAQKVHADIASAVFRPSYDEYQDFRLRSAKQFVRLANRIARRNPKFSVKPANALIQEAITWAEAQMDDSQYTLRLVPSNELAETPEGRADLLQDLINGGTIPQQDGMRLIAQGRDDLLGYLKEQPWYASYQYTQKAITNILRGKQPLPVVDFLNLPAALSAAQTAYLDATVGGCPVARLDKLDRWMAQVKTVIDRNKPPPPPPMPAPGAPPPPGGHQLGAGLPPGALPPPKQAMAA